MVFVNPPSPGWGNPLLWCALATLIAYSVFLYFYWTGSPAWKHDPLGRALMLSKVFIVSLLAHAVFVYFVGDYPFRVFVWVAIFTAGTIAGTYQTVMLRRIQRQRTRDGHPRRRVSDL